MLAKIFQPARSAMQSGPARHRQWVLEFVPAQARWIDPLMGWTGSGDMNSQVRLSFPTREEAIGLPSATASPTRCSSRSGAATSCGRTATATTSPPSAARRGPTDGPLAQLDRAADF